MTFLWKIGVICRELVTDTKKIICILLKYRYISHNNNLMLISDLF